MRLSEVLCRTDVASSSKQSDSIRRRKPHTERCGLPESEGSDENFLKVCEVQQGCELETLTWREWYGPDVAGFPDSEGELTITLSFEDV